MAYRDTEGGFMPTPPEQIYIRINKVGIVDTFSISFNSIFVIFAYYGLLSTSSVPTHI